MVPRVRWLSTGGWVCLFHAFQFAIMLRLTGYKQELPEGKCEANSTSNARLHRLQVKEHLWQWWHGQDCWMLLLIAFKWNKAESRAVLLIAVDWILKFRWRGNTCDVIYMIVDIRARTWNGMYERRGGCVQWAVALSDVCTCVLESGVRRIAIARMNEKKHLMAGAKWGQRCDSALKRKKS